MGCSSLSVAKVSACHREAITMLYAITMLFYRSTHRDVRTDPWVVFPLLHSDIFVFFYFVFFSFWNSAFQNTTFSPLSDLITSLFPSLIHLLPDLAPSPLSLLFLASLTAMQQLPGLRFSSSAEDLDSERLR